MALQRYELKYYTADDRMLEFEDPAQLRILGRKGDWSGVPAEPAIERSSGGDDGVLAGISLPLPELTVEIAIRDSGGYQADIAQDVMDLMGPMLLDGSRNRGWLYYRRLMHHLSVPSSSWRIPVVPIAPVWEPVDDDGEDWITGLTWRATAAVWEADPATTLTIKAISDATWSTVTQAVTPGGNWTCLPTWEIDGPSSGTITSVTLDNLTTGATLSLSNISLGNGQTLTVTTGFRAKNAEIAGVNQNTKLSNTSDFFPLLPGENSLRITKNGTSQSAARLIYRPRRNGVY